MSLFQSLPKPDRTKTQLVYEACYYPPEKLTEYHKVCWAKHLYLTKETILERREDAQLYHPSSGMFPIAWLYNNVPSELEWNGFNPLWKFHVYLRISPLIPNGGRVALIGKL